MFKVFGSETLLSEDMNDIMRQTIIRVATHAELTALPPLDVGTVAYVEADDTYYRRTVTTWTRLLPADTGWNNLTYSSGFSGTGQARVKAGVLMLRGVVQRDTGNFPTSFENVALLPVGMEPSSVLRVMTGVPASVTPRFVVLQIAAGSRQLQAATIGATGYNSLYLTGVSAPTD